MKMTEIISLLDARLLCGAVEDDYEFDSAFASDMMSDVLAYGQGQALLLTGLLNQQVIRTAEMMDMRCVVFVRGKKPTFDVIDLAEECGIVLLTTEERMYAACGKLYAAGLTGGSVLPK